MCKTFAASCVDDWCQVQSLTVKRSMNPCASHMTEQQHVMKIYVVSHGIRETADGRLERRTVKRDRKTLTATTDANDVHSLNILTFTVDHHGIH